MQLDLFLDNRRIILGNLADEHLRNLELDEAAGLYDRILAEWPDDATVVSARRNLESWRNRLQRFHSSPSGAERIYALFRNLNEYAPASLKAGLRSFIIEQLKLEPSPELIFIFPRFHVGCLLMETGRTVEAETWFASALDSGIPEQGRFFAYRGDALFVKGETDAARECYRDALLLAPLEVDFDHLLDPTVREMPIEMEEEGLSGEDAIRWIPVWGWLLGVFTLGANAVDGIPAVGGSGWGIQESSENSSPSLWFEFLRYAERLRTVQRDDAELVRIRRRMRELNSFMFGRYMEKIRG